MSHGEEDGGRIGAIPFSEAPPKADLVIVYRLPENYDPASIPAASIYVCSKCARKVACHWGAVPLIENGARVACVECVVAEYPHMIDMIAHGLNTSAFVALATDPDTIETSIDALYANDPSRFVTPNGYRVLKITMPPEENRETFGADYLAAIVTGPGLPADGMPFPVPKSYQGCWSRRLCMLLEMAYGAPPPNFAAETEPPSKPS
jgi:DNA-directed RNA polymerase subunit RPC12/RpoP